MRWWNDFKGRWGKRRLRERAYGRPLGFAPDAPAFRQRRAERGFAGRDEADDDLVRGVEDLAERSRLGEQNATSHLIILGEQHRLVESSQYRGSPAERDHVERSYAVAMRYLQEHPPGDDCSVCVHASPASDVNLKAGASHAGFGREPSGSRPRPHRPVPAMPAPLPSDAAAGLRGIAMFGAEGNPDATENVCAILVALPAAGGLEGVLGAVVMIADGPEITTERLRAAHGALADPGARASFGRSVRDTFSPPRDEFGFAGFAFGNAARLQAVRKGAPLALLDPHMGWELGY